MIPYRFSKISSIRIENAISAEARPLVWPHQRTVRYVDSGLIDHWRILLDSRKARPKNAI